MTTLMERYEEITALVDYDDLEEAAHGGAPEDFILAAADMLGFDEPALALDLDRPLEDLMEAFVR